MENILLTRPYIFNFNITYIILLLEKYILYLLMPKLLTLEFNLNSTNKLNNLLQNMKQNLKLKIKNTKDSI